MDSWMDRMKDGTARHEKDETMADCTKIPHVLETVNFRQPNVREKASKKTHKVNRTSGEYYAGKAWKRDHPEFWWEGEAKRGGTPHKRLVRKGKTVSRKVMA